MLHDDDLNADQKAEYDRVYDRMREQGLSPELAHHVAYLQATEYTSIFPAFR